MVKPGRDLPFLVGLLVLAVIFFSGILFRTDGAVVGSTIGDMANLFIPMRQFAYSCLSRGILPFWNPYIYCGTPFLADPFSAIFYPVNLLYLCLPISRAVNLSVALQTLLSGVFCYCCIRSISRFRASAFIGSLVYMFGAVQVCHIFAGHLCVLSTMVWIPLLFLFSENYFCTRSSAYPLLGGVTLALQIFASHMQIVFYSCIGLALFWAFRAVLLARERGRFVESLRLAAVFAAMIGCGIALASIQLFPAVEYLCNSARGAATYEFCSHFSFPPENLITFLMPDMMGDAVQLRYWGRCYFWEMCAYIGVFPLLAACFGMFAGRRRDRVFFAGLACVSLILAFGRYTPLLRILYTCVPGFAFFRGNSKFIVLTTFSLATLCALGIDGVLSTPGRALRSFSTIVLAVSSAALIASAVILLFREETVVPWKAILRCSASLDRLFNRPPSPDDAAFVAASRAVAEKSFLNLTGFLFVGALILFFRARGVLGAFPAGLCIAVAVVADLFSFGMRYMVSFPQECGLWPTQVVDRLRRDEERHRVLTVDLLENQGMVHCVGNMTGYGPNAVSWYTDFIEESQGMKPYTAGVLNFSTLFNVLNVKYIMLSRAYQADEDLFPLAEKTPFMRVYLNRRFLPRAYLVHDVRLIPNREGIFHAMRSASFDPRRTAILEDETCPFPFGGETVLDDEFARIVSYAPNRVEITARVSTDAYLVLADTWYPGWKARVDGREETIYRAYRLLRAVYLGPGAHTVEFFYYPLTFKIGMGISIAAVAGSVVWAILIRWRAAGGRTAALGRGREMR